MFYSYTNRPPRRKFINDEPSMTIQSAADETDINVMIARYQKTGSFHGSTNMPTVRPQFGDFVGVPEYQNAINILIQAQDQFAALPANIRDRFANSPEKYLEFLSDSANKEEAIKLGLVNAPVVVEDSKSE